MYCLQVAFRAERLQIFDEPITEIWDKQPLPKSKKEAESFCKLRLLRVWRCVQLVYALPSYMLPQLQESANPRDERLCGGGGWSCWSQWS